MNSETITRNIPLAGVVAFALASVWSLFQKFNNSALHPTLLYWVPACLVEIVTAWLVYQVVESLRIVTDTKSLKRDRRFHAILSVACAILASPTLWVSYVANKFEFQGDNGLALIIPLSCISCAVASAIPHVKARNVDARLEEEREKTRKVKKELAQLRASIAQPVEEIAKALTVEERRTQLLDIWCQDGDKSFAELAQGFKVSRQTISNDFAKLRGAGKVRRNGSGIEVISKSVTLQKEVKE